MRFLIALIISCLSLSIGLAVAASDSPLERLLRLQVFNQAFEGFDYYHVTIEDDRPQADGSREVTAVASGRFLESTKRIKVRLLIVGDQVLGGQVLEGIGLPPCLAPGQSRTS
ncbi:hypothetical protein ACO9S2_09860 [Nitrospira sp. NS4]|uniref:hypothetical protein n=1 Tax=Nitrospira sp. NS4 TaxID=3414498 RepID=UPI003C2C43B4